MLGKSTLQKPVNAWLILGLVMIFMQIIIGGITRLTGSGLSITKWDIVTGMVPPLNETQWNQEFDLYKQTPQYQKINQGIPISTFKWIFFWEYLHRLWARSMGFVFLLPFIYFWVKNYLSKTLKTDLIIVVILAGIVGAFGWIMVASGLVSRPWVNAYKLSLHLGLALVTLCYLWWTWLKTRTLFSTLADRNGRSRMPVVFFTLVSVQILVGGMMSGMKAALLYPTFPKMNQYWLDPIILEASSWKWIHFVDYDVYPFLPALVQVLHRGLAMIILGLFVLLLRRIHDPLVKGLGLILVLQITLGIFTLIYSKGYIPIGLGVCHQAVGILLLVSSLTLVFKHRTIP